MITIKIGRVLPYQGEKELSQGGKDHMVEKLLGGGGDTVMSYLRG